MAQSFKLDDLIAAVAGAVIEAQDKVDRHQADTIRQYFDELGRPICLDIKLPSTRAGSAPDDYDQLSVPQLALAPVSLLQISDVTIEFDVELGDLSSFASAIAPDVEAMAPQTSGAPLSVPNLGLPAATLPPSLLGRPASAQPAQLAVGLQSSAPSTGSMAKIKLRVEGQPPTEGMARLIAKLNQRI